MCGHTGYQLKLDQYLPPKCEAACQFRKGGSVLNFSKSSDGDELVTGSKHGVSGDAEANNELNSQILLGKAQKVRMFCSL